MDLRSLLVVSVLLLIVGLVLLSILKKLLWWAFSFDNRVDKILKQKKSSEVRLGKISESLAPILSDFPVDINKPGTSLVFLGQPVDYVYFDPEEGVTFIEVKSGGSRLSQSQKKIKEQVAAGNISWKDFSIKGD